MDLVILISLLCLEYLSHAQCMRNAQADYQLCAQEYQLRIKSLNEVIFNSQATLLLIV